MEDFMVNNYCPEEITDALVKLAGLEETITEAESAEMVDAVYNLLAMAQNKYNRDGYRLVYKALMGITECFQMGQIKMED